MGKIHKKIRHPSKACIRQTIITVLESWRQRIGFSRSAVTTQLQETTTQKKIDKKYIINKNIQQIRQTAKTQAHKIKMLVAPSMEKP